MRWPCSTSSRHAATPRPQTGTVDTATWQELLGWSQTYDQTLCYATGGSSASTLSTPRAANVQSILGATRAAGGNRNAQVIALMTAMQESKLCNIQLGDRDSLGLFQQRPSQGWCSGGAAADAVQRSCCPDAYAQGESMATNLADTYEGVAPLKALPTAPSVRS